MIVRVRPSQECSMSLIASALLRIVAEHLLEDAGARSDLFGETYEILKEPLFSGNQTKARHDTSANEAS